ncbi:MAG: hypothetical protein L0H94_00845 [Nitrospira sp.]|nr:hypothetical protein [Nitrospira sp.]
MSSLLHFNASILVVLLSFLGTVMTGCARLPETTRVLHEDDRVVVKMETDLDAHPATHTSPTDFSNEQLTSLLRGFSVRMLSRVPVHLLADSVPARKLFWESELDALVPILREALQKVGLRERIRFEVLLPGRNPLYWRDVTGGWVKVQDRYFHLHVDYFHVEQPIRKSSAYDRSYPTPWTPERAYLIYFEPARMYVTDPSLNEYAVDLSLFRGDTSP